ncbi:hypothetical protein BKA67DRAFT_568030 [Truncatella angustata]|uniref:Zn(2)-C6 fungal-type domain-containing protein n=1 Tax=Truncatella angustata TaxID=152316 RepID=A0A9P8ZXC3_9PEZI|nr:uncharacterized protein BKA67DRAFT_568030 [Truncatella angustata]KAH6652938.1 hypothetical protein BKA67DRAFT_568030 [Truncatella angustata]
MALGPFDSRAKRSRCLCCAESHLKCSREFPCKTCVRRNLVCKYPGDSSIQTITLDLGQHKTSMHYSNSVTNNAQVAYNHLPPLTQSPSSDSTHRYIHYFGLFVQKNTFNPQCLSYDASIKSLLGTRGACPLVQAVLAIGALEASKVEVNRPKEFSNYTSDVQFSLNSYSRAIITLRDYIDSLETPSRIQVLWTTLLLGLFELMHDPTGNGWIKHMVYGTSRAVEAAGPEFFRTEPGKSFFSQVRIFETCRTIVFNETTFLTRSDWAALSFGSREANFASPQHPLESLLDIITMCAKLSAGAGNLIDTLDQLDPVTVNETANDLALEGHRLRRNLLLWNVTNSQMLNNSSVSNKFEDRFPVDSIAVLINAFFSAVSIYLSGIFDYNIYIWNDLGIPTPTLTEEDIQAHVRIILHSTRCGLERTSLSHLLHLFPLRVAGARCTTPWQREEILALLRNAKSSFSATEAFETELTMLWRMNPRLPA